MVFGRLHVRSAGLKGTVPDLRPPRDVGLPMTLDSGLLAFAQWLISQGIGVAVAVAVLWLVGRKVDQQNGMLAELRTAVAQLTQAIADRFPKSST